MTRRDLLIAVLLGLAGFVGNWFKLELFFDVDILFGSILVMLALVRCGTAAGMVAAVIAGSCTIVLWHHPWASLILIVEALVVGVLVNRRRFSLVGADILYWLAIGVPLIWLFYHQVLGVGIQPALLISLKQPFNGILNALLAQIILLVFHSRSPAPGDAAPSLRQLIFLALMAMAMCAGLLYLTYHLKRIMEYSQRTLSQQVIQVSDAASSFMDRMMAEHHQSIRALALLTGDPATASPAELMRLLTAFKQASPAVLRIGVIDRAGISKAFMPARDDQGRSNLGVDFSDRPYIPYLRITGRPYIGDVVLAKVGRPEPIVPLLAPIMVNGTYRGYCASILDLSVLRHYLAGMADSQTMRITILDRSGRVVASTRPELEVMSRFQLPTGELLLKEDQVFHLVPEARAGFSAMQRWRASWVVREREISPELGWKVVVEHSFLPTVHSLTQETILGLAMTLALVISAAAIAWLISNGLVRALRQLERVSNEFPRLLEQRQTVAVWPVSRIREVAGLTENFRAMTVLLTGMFTRQGATYDRLLKETEARQRLEASMNSLRERVEFDERSRISRELHDGIGQSLQAINLSLKLFHSDVQRGEPLRSAGLLEGLINDTSRASEELREIVTTLRPGVLTVPLDQALRWHCSSLTERVGLAIELAIDGDCAGLGETVNIALFRITQEALTNVIRHARADRAEVVLRSDGTTARLRISDNGIGGVQPAEINTRAVSGLTIMRERAELAGGTFSIYSPPGNGTTIMVTVPVA